MKIPSELLVAKERLGVKISDMEARIADSERILQMFSCEMKGICQAIDIIEQEPDAEVPAEDPVAALILEHDPENVTLEPRKVEESTSSRAPRRNIPDLLRAALGSAAPGEWLNITDLVKSLGVQKSQLEKALGKLTSAEWDRDMDQVRWPVEEEGPSAEDRAAVGELRNGKDLENVVELLSRHSVGISDLVLIGDYGYSRPHLEINREAGKIWCDSRGYWHVVTSGSVSPEAAE